MKTPEDEAFEDIERRQGGGFARDMTLRDWYAGLALQGLISANGPNQIGAWPMYAECVAYKVADAMLKAREAK
jgi:hypothetical protein